VICVYTGERSIGGGERQMVLMSEVSTNCRVKQGFGGEKKESSEKKRPTLLVGGGRRRGGRFIR